MCIRDRTFLLIGKAIGKQIAEQSDDPKVSICMDGRISGPSLKRSLISGLTFMGVNVIDIGSLPTPLLYYSLKKLNINNGLIILLLNELIPVKPSIPVDLKVLIKKVSKESSM